MNNHTPPACRGTLRDPAKEKFWRDVMRRFRASGHDGRAFCKANNLSEVSFYSWRRTIAERDAEAAESCHGARKSPIPHRGHAAEGLPDTEGAGIADRGEN